MSIWLWILLSISGTLAVEVIVIAFLVWRFNVWERNLATRPQVYPPIKWALHAVPKEPR